MISIEIEECGAESDGRPFRSSAPDGSGGRIHHRRLFRIILFLLRPDEELRHPQFGLDQHFVVADVVVGVHLVVVVFQYAQADPVAQQQSLGRKQQPQLLVPVAQRRRN